MHSFALAFSDNKTTKASLKKILSRTFTLTPERNVTVKKSLILPQGYGAFRDCLHTADTEMQQLIKYGGVLIIDSGHYSLDFIYMQNQKLQPALSGTSLDSTNKIYETIQKEMIMAGYTEPPISRIESTVIQNKSFIYCSGEKVSIKPFFEKAHRQITHSAMRSIKNKFIKNGNGIDLIIISGGSANIFKSAVTESFQHCKNIFISNKPEFANSRGFWHAARGLYAK